MNKDEKDDLNQGKNDTWDGDLAEIMKEPEIYRIAKYELYRDRESGPYRIMQPDNLEPYDDLGGYYYNCASVEFQWMCQDRLLSETIQKRIATWDKDFHLAWQAICTHAITIGYILVRAWIFKEGLSKKWIEKPFIEFLTHPDNRIIFDSLNIDYKELCSRYCDIGRDTRIRLLECEKMLNDRIRDILQFVAGYEKWLAGSRTLSFHEYISIYLKTPLEIWLPNDQDLNHNASRARPGRIPSISLKECKKAYELKQTSKVDGSTPSNAEVAIRMNKGRPSHKQLSPDDVRYRIQKYAKELRANK